MAQTYSSRPLAVVTGASSGIGYELARCCAESGFDLVVAADRPEIDSSAARLRESGVDVRAVQEDLARIDGVEALYRALEGRPVEVLIANAGHGLGKAFLDQELDDARHVVDTNVTGTIALLHRIGRDMRQRGNGRILITGSIAGFLPGSYQAVYNASKAFLDSFAYALREELKDSGVSVTLLMPGATETEFFERADLMDTKIGTSKKDDPAEVAKAGFEAMMQGEPGVVTGLKNKLQVAAARVTPATRLAVMHRRKTEPGSAEQGTGSTARLVGTAGAILGGIVLTGFLLNFARARRPARVL
jgi:short-subunit dehydrogenase